MLFLNWKMALKPFKIRLRTAKGGSTHDVPPDWTLLGLKTFISQTLEIPIPRQRLLTGFPPIEISHPDETPTKQFLKNGDTITVDIKLDYELEQPDPGAPTIRETVLNRTPGKENYGDDYEIIVRKIPSDNSCLFNAAGYVLDNRSRTAGGRIRKEVAQFIHDHPDTFTEAVLGKRRGEYLRWISNPNSWGGEIEVSALCQIFQTMIGVINITLKRLHIYGENDKYPRLVWLIYDGIHYDAVVISPFKEDGSSNSADESQDVTIFDPNRRDWKQVMQSLGETLHTRGGFVDTSSFSIMCKQCGANISGELGVARHARQTGHTDFVQSK